MKPELQVRFESCNPGPASVDRAGEAVALAPEHHAEWDDFVARQPNATVYASSAWKKVLEEGFPHIRGFFLAVKDPRSGSIRAGLPVYCVRSWLLGDRLVSVPFANFSDPLASGADDFAPLLAAAKNILLSVRAKGLECRPRRLAAVLVQLGFALTNLYKHNYLRLEGQTPEQLKHGFSRTCVRQWLTKAEQRHLSLRVETAPQDVDAFFGLLTATRKRLGLPPIPRRFFDAIIRHLPPERRQVLVAMHNDHAVAAALVLKSHGIHSLEYVGTEADERRIGAGPWLYWQALQRACAERGRIFSFGRTSPLNTTLLDHKRRWGTEEEDLMVCATATSGRPRMFVRERTLCYRLVRHVSALAPPPLYRLLGEFCYRHLG